MNNSFNWKKLKNIFQRFKRSQTPLSQTDNNLIHQNYRSDILFIFTLFVLTITLYFCWGIINNPDANPENVKSAFSLIVAIVSGLLGFVTGKAIS
ncbi:MAG: hypothetical protein QNJ33_09980 [Crocosphaera sp.]|nr:hypothetical protein [Crocosphaera sp.]